MPRKTTSPSVPHLPDPVAPPTCARLWTVQRSRRSSPFPSPPSTSGATSAPVPPPSVSANTSVTTRTSSDAGWWTTARELPDVAGNVARRPDGKWRARYRDGAGKEHAKHFDRKSDAERWLAAAQVALSRGEWVDPSLSRVTVEEWAKIWLDGLSHLKPTTRTRYTSILGAHVLPRWGKTPLA